MIGLLVFASGSESLFFVFFICYLVFLEFCFSRFFLCGRPLRQREGFDSQLAA